MHNRAPDGDKLSHRLTGSQSWRSLIQLEIPPSRPLRRETANQGGAGESSEMRSVYERLRALRTSTGLTLEALSRISGFAPLGVRRGRFVVFRRVCPAPRTQSERDHPCHDRRL
jgi:hypothetical protein